MPSIDEHRIREVAGLAGLSVKYEDAFGRKADAPTESLALLLAALGYPVDTDANAIASLRRLEARRAALVPRLIVAVANANPVIIVRASAGSTVAWRIVAEDGEESEGESTAVEGEGSTTIGLPPLAAGYHRLRLADGGRNAYATILSAPGRCWRPSGRQKLWGLSAPVYGLVSETNLGIGDFGDVRALAIAAAKRGASFLGLSPLHTLFPANRRLISPYSPSSRLFFDPIYIDTGSVTLADGDRNPARSGEIAGGPQATEPFVNYPAVWARKRAILMHHWESFRDAGGSPEFDQFRQTRGLALERHAEFEVRAQGGAVNSGMHSFHAWQQWIADRQFATASADARTAGMSLGLFADLAVGASPLGSEVFSGEGQYVTAASIGAPPDLLAPNGQDWSLCALNPLAIEDDGLARFRLIVEANMRHAAGIRIDHAFQLQRLFLIPNGETASRGTYLSYPVEAMFAVLRIESHRAKCMVIGEDLGTSPPRFSETLEASEVFGYRVLYFEREDDGRFKHPDTYPKKALAVINTHDLATFTGWWRGQDIEDRLRHGIFEREAAQLAVADRGTARQQLASLLHSEGLIDQAEPPAEPPFEAVARLLARSRAELVSVQLDDLAGAKDAQNIPGVVEGAPNWRRRLPVTVAELAEPGGPLDGLGQAMAAEGRGPDVLTGRA